MMRGESLPTVLVLGSGMMVPALVDYLLDTCGLRVVLTDPRVEHAARVLGDRALGTPVAWVSGDEPLLDRLVHDADVVVSMLPPALHHEVARACLRHRRHLVTTSYLDDAMAAFDHLARALDVLLLTEVGESPGLDHMSVMALIDEARARAEEIVSVRSYAGGLPAHGSGANPWGYKFSWRPRGVFEAARHPAAYLERGRRVELGPGEQFGHCRTVTIEGAGTFEAYPNRDATRYLREFGVSHRGTLCRSLLRHPGWCATMRALNALGLIDSSVIQPLRGMTYGAFLARLVGCAEPALRDAVARRVGCDREDPVVERLAWLGLFGDARIELDEGTPLDVLLELAVPRLSYGPQEQDMVVLHCEVCSRLGRARYRRTATLVVEGTAGGHSAMAQAVGLPAGICTRLLVEGSLRPRGVHGPFRGEIYAPVLRELATRGLAFRVRESTLPSRA